MLSSGIHVVREMGPPSGKRGRGGSEHELLSLPGWSISSNQLQCKWSTQGSTQCNAMRRHLLFLQLSVQQPVLQKLATPIGRQGTRLCKGRAFAMTNCWGSARMLQTHKPTRSALSQASHEVTQVTPFDLPQNIARRPLMARK